MQTYTVHEPRDRAADRLERAERLVFVKDGFSLGAALLAPLWMLAHRLWLPFLAYFGAIAAIEIVAWAFGLGETTAGWMMLALHILVGLEADSIRRWSLSRRGFALIGSVSGRTAEDCERRFFEAWLRDQPMIPPPPGDRAASMMRGRLGTFPLLPRRV